MIKLDKLIECGRYKHCNVRPTTSTTDIPLEFIRLDPEEVEYLYNVAGTATKGIVEIGRFRGGSTLVLASANPSVPVMSIDISPRDDAYLCKLAAQFDIDNIKLQSISSADATIEGEFDMLFIDGDHSYEGCLFDLVKWGELLSVGGNIVLHDCFYNSGVFKAVVQFLQTRRSNYVVLNVPLIHTTMYKVNATGFGSFCHLLKIK